MIKTHEVILNIYGKSNAVAEFTDREDALEYKQWLNDRPNNLDRMHAEIEEAIVFESFKECMLHRRGSD